MVKNVKNNYSKYLINKTLRDAILKDLKKLQVISAEDDIEKGYELIKKNILMRLNFFINLKFLIGMIFGKTGSVDFSWQEFLEQIMDLKDTIVI